MIEAGKFKHMQTAWKLRETVRGLSNLSEAVEQTWKRWMKGNRRTEGARNKYYTVTRMENAEYTGSRTKSVVMNRGWAA